MTTSEKDQAGMKKENVLKKKKKKKKDEVKTTQNS